MVRIPARLRESVFRRAKNQCEYCQTQQGIVVDMVVDHITPESRDGETVANNLCCACHRCNRYKHNHVTGFDMIDGDEVALFNPRKQNWDNHFEWSRDKLSLVGKTATGRATIQRLRINDDVMISARRIWVAAGWHPPK